MVGITHKITFIVLICFGFQAIWMYTAVYAIDFNNDNDMVMENTNQHVFHNIRQVDNDVQFQKTVSDLSTQDQHKSHSHNCCHICYASYIGLTPRVYFATLSEPNENYDKSVFYNRKIAPPFRPPIV
jgi:ABC-type nickel/cobalt efflux system permease component RcnA